MVMTKKEKEAFKTIGLDQLAKKDLETLHEEFIEKLKNQTIEKSNQPKVQEDENSN